MLDMNVTTAMLADSATVETSGKLYVHGGGWAELYAASVPVTHPMMSLVLVVEVPWAEVLEDIAVDVDLVDEDNHPLGVHARGKLNVGVGPGTRRGDSVSVPAALPFSMVQLTSYGRYRFIVKLNEHEAASVRFNLRKVPGAP